MKITRIQRIRNHRVFRDFSWPVDLPDFGNFNLIYGWNGSGKTTLSSLFRHLGNREPIQEGEVQFVIDQQVVTNNNLDSASLPPIRVFNRNFIDASIFETAGKQFSPIYFLGEDSVEKQKQVEDLKVELQKTEVEKTHSSGKHEAALSEFEAFCTDQARIVRELLTAPGSTYNNYDKRNFKEAAKQLSDATYASYLLDEQQKATLKKAKDGKPKPKIPPFQADYPDLAVLTGDTQRLLGRSIASRVIEELANDQHLASWVEVGLPLHIGDRASSTCRFCGNPLPDERLQYLQAHFNDDFRQFQVELGSVIAKVSAGKKLVEDMTPPEKLLLYDHLAEEYGQAVGKLSLHRSNVAMYLDALLGALTAKKDSPFVAVPLLPFFGIPSATDEPASTLRTIFSVVVAGTGAIGALLGKDAFQKIGSLINAHNNLTDNYFGEIVKAKKKLEASYVAEAFVNFARRQQAVDATKVLEQEAGAKVQKLRDNIAALLRAIRQHHRPAAELTDEIRAYLGRDELAFAAHENGYTLTRYGQAATNLSEGERTSIAFMYFLKSLQDTAFDMANGVVVIDDPASSLDSNSLYSAFGFMRDRTKGAGQLFVLTHNFAFFRQVKNWYGYLSKKKYVVRYYMLIAGAHADQRNSVLCPLDSLLQDFDSEYHYLFKQVYDGAIRPAAAVTLAENYGVPNIARRVLEAFLAFRLPDKPNSLYQQLEQIAFDPAKKARILRFLDTHSHFPQIAEPEHDLSILSETQGVLKDVLNLIEVMDGDHYRQMLTRLSQ